MVGQSFRGVGDCRQAAVNRFGDSVAVGFVKGSAAAATAFESGVSENSGHLPMADI